MIMQMLKSATQVHHNEVEKLAYSNRIMDGTITLDEYKELILKQRYFHINVEPYYTQLFSEKEAANLEIDKRKKAHLLKYDLLELGLDESMLVFEKYPNLEIENAEEALGAMYVLEGSTLGGAAIRRKLEKNPLIKGYTTFNYYGCYGKDTGEFWKKFIIQATIMGDTKKKQEIIINKAQETFTYFANILKMGVINLKERQESI